jgi:hypothetical protein
MSYHTEIEILSWIASTGSLVKLVPQIYHIVKNPELSAGMSTCMLICGTISGFASITIGVLKRLPSFAIGYGAVTTGYLILIAFKCRSCGNQSKVSVTPNISISGIIPEKSNNNV